MGNICNINKYVIKVKYVNDISSEKNKIHIMGSSISTIFTFMCLTFLDIVVCCNNIISKYIQEYANTNIKNFQEQIIR